MKQVRHVIWDWNGTLFDDAWLCVEIINKILKLHDLPLLTPEAYAEVFDFPVREYYKKIGLNSATVSFDTVADLFIDDYKVRRFECGIRPDAIDTLERLRDQGFMQSVLSAYEQSALLELVEHYGLQSFFVDIAGIEDYYADGKIGRGRELVRSGGLTPSEAVLVGDSRHDFEVAGELGTSCVLMPGGHQSRDRLLSCGAPVVNSLMELPGLLKESG